MENFVNVNVSGEKKEGLKKDNNISTTFSKCNLIWFAGTCFTRSRIIGINELTWFNKIVNTYSLKNKWTSRHFILL